MNRKSDADQSDISIYVVCHNDSFVPNLEFLKPIQVGAANSKSRLDNMLHDDEGDNISSENRMYCELTAQYWAWKNDARSDYIGFFHYRRFLSFSPIAFDEDGAGNVIVNRLDDETLNKLWLKSNIIKKEVTKYDIITSKPTKLHGMGETVYSHYKSFSPYHRIEDLDVAIEVICELYPDYADAAKKYINSTEAYFCNLYIMNRKTFNEYNEWVFSVINEHKKRRDFSDYSIDEGRIYGFLSERLFGIWFTYKKEYSSIKYKELQRTLITDTSAKKQITPFYVNNNIPIVFGCDNHYIPIIGTLIKSIAENSSKDYNYDCLILNTDIEEKNKEFLINEFIHSENISIRFIDVAEYFSDLSLFVCNHFSTANYYRLVMGEVLSSYEKVIYLDSDIIVEGDLSVFYNLDMNDNYILATRDVDWISFYQQDKSRKERAKKDFGEINPFEYFNSGVMLCNVKRLGSIPVDKLLKLASSYDWMMVDQDVLNKELYGKVGYVGFEWNLLIDYNDGCFSRLEYSRGLPKKMYEDYLIARKNPKIIHFAGAQKPWNYIYCDMSQYFWKYARQTSFYEQLLIECVDLQSNAEQKGNKEINIKEDNDFIYVDGVLAKLINKFNSKYPHGSKKRERIRRIVHLFIK